MRADDYISQRITELCEEREMSRYRLAQLTGMSQTAIGNIIKKITMPSIPTLERICNAFGISLAQFFSKGALDNLSDVQKELLEIYGSLEQKERDILITVARGLSSK